MKKLKRKGYDLGKLNRTLHDMERYNRQQLVKEYHDHALQGALKGYRELHIAGDWLLVYTIDKKRLILALTYTGSHDDVLRAH